MKTSFRLAALAMPLAFASYSQANEGMYGVYKDKAENRNPRTESPGKAAKTKKQDEKASLAPNSIMIRSSLEGALADVQGLKSQIDAVPDLSSKESMDHVKVYKSDLSSDLDRAQTHLRNLQSGINQFPELAQSGEIRSLDSSIQEVQSLRRSWSDRSEGVEYWKNKEQVRNDLNSLEDKLNQAISRTENFNSDRLGVEFG